MLELFDQDSSKFLERILSLLTKDSNRYGSYVFVSFIHSFIYLFIYLFVHSFMSFISFSSNAFGGCHAPYVFEIARKLANKSATLQESWPQCCF